MIMFRYNNLPLVIFFLGKTRRVQWQGGSCAHLHYRVDIGQSQFSGEHLRASPVHRARWWKTRGVRAAQRPGTCAQRMWHLRPTYLWHLLVRGSGRNGTSQSSRHPRPGSLHPPPPLQGNHITIWVASEELGIESPSRSYICCPCPLKVVYRLTTACSSQPHQLLNTCLKRMYYSMDWTCCSRFFVFIEEQK